LANTASLSSLSVRKVTVIGVGIMGSGIALACAKGGCDVSVWDVDPSTVKRASATIRSALNTLIDTNTISKKKADSSLKRITPTSEMSRAVEDAQLVFEAVPEILSLKRRILKELGSLCRSAILASNTSTFKISALTSATRRPSQVIGTHWMNPPYILPLVEVIPSAKTSTKTTNSIRCFLQSIGKRPVMCKDTPGFIVNRIHSALLVEAVAIVEKGIASVEDVDMVWTQHLGPRYCVVGPLALMDSFGLDTEHSQYSYLQKMTRENKFKPPKLLTTKVRKKQLGLKTGRGFYNYTGKNISSITRERDKKFIELLRYLGI